MRKILCALLLVSSVASAQERWFKPFMPENDLYKDDNLASSNITEKEFDAILAYIESVYKPVVAYHGAKLVVEKEWSKSTVNAYATQRGCPSLGQRCQWIIHFYGGLARRHEVTADGFALVAAHELAHHLGGFPQSSWASVEGQSDYIATHSIAKELWKNDVEKNAESAKIIPAYPKGLCDEAYKENAERNLCYRIMLAGKSLADLLSDSTARFDKPSKEKVERTNPNHPAGQCRLDTYMAGVQCLKAYPVRVLPKSEKESAKYNCVGKELGARPACWFKGSL
jgi:hypothetical protein